MRPTTTQLAEYNATYLGLISLQNRLPKRVQHGWSSTIGDASNGAGIECETTYQAVVPHGLANDVFAAVVTAGVAAREGGDRVIQMTTAEIVRQGSMSQYSDVYVSVRTALDSLANTRYRIWNNWRTPLLNVAERRTLNLIDAVTERTEDHPFDPNKNKIVYEIRLNPDIVESIDGALTLVTNPELLSALSSPGARGLYRLLEAWRRDPHDFNHVRHQVNLSAYDLVESCRLLANRQEPASLLRPLFEDRGPFSQLREAGYLTEYTTVGRGWETQITIRFAQTASLLNTGAFRLLVEAGVNGRNAEQLASIHSLEAVECAIWEVDQKIKKSKDGIRNPPGLIITTLKGNDFPILLEKYRQRNRGLAVGQVVKPRVKPAHTEPVEPVLTAQQELEVAHTNLVSVSALKSVTPDQSGQIHHLIDVGKITPADIRSLVMLPREMVKEKVRAWLSVSGSDPIDVQADVAELDIQSATR